MAARPMSPQPTFQVALRMDLSFAFIVFLILYSCRFYLYKGPGLLDTRPDLPPRTFTLVDGYKIEEFWLWILSAFNSLF